VPIYISIILLYSNLYFSRFFSFFLSVSFNMIYRDSLAL